MKKQWLLLMLLCVFAARAGVYRHDVPAEKYKKLAREQQFDCVGMSLTNCGEDNHGACRYLGGCVLIDKKYVLSAAHLFTRKDIRFDTIYLDKNYKKSDKAAYAAGGSMMILNQPIRDWQDTSTLNFAFRFGDRMYYAKRWLVYPPYLDSINATPRTEFCGDLILIELEDTVAGVTPAVLNETFDEQGSMITCVGYGSSGPANRHDDIDEFYEKIAGQNMVDNIEGFKVNGKASLLSCDFDGPDGKRNRMGSAKSLPLEWEPAGGDCGGGLFRNVKGHWQLVGIITGGGPSATGFDFASIKGDCYGGIFDGLRISVFNEWIKKSIANFKMTESSVNDEVKKD